MSARARWAHAPGATSGSPAPWTRRSSPICDPHHPRWDGETARVAPRYLLDEILAGVRRGHNIVSPVFRPGWTIQTGVLLRPDPVIE